MKQKLLRIAPGVSIPAEDFIESATGFIGKRGAGKSGGVKVLEEELFRVGLPFITLDPVGVHWGIKSSFDGKSPGLPVLVIGGEHGDLRLERRAGAEIARAVVEANISCVIDFSQEPKAAYRQFVSEFAHELFRINKSPRVVILEEAPALVPQKIPSDRAELYEAVERLVSRGRNKGIGVVLVGQRAATINKDVLTQIDNLFVGRLVGKTDRKALGEWVEAWDVEDKFGEFMESLATLPTRTMWLWSPEALKKFEPIRFKDFTTFHADLTHMRRLGLLDIQPVTTDVSAVVTKLGKEMEKFAKEKTDASEVVRLRQKVRELEGLAHRAGEQQHEIRKGYDNFMVEPLKQQVAELESERKRLISERDAANTRLRRLGDIRKQVLAIASKQEAHGKQLQESLLLLAGQVGADALMEHVEFHARTTPPSAFTSSLTPRRRRHDPQQSHASLVPRNPEFGGPDVVNGEVQIKAGARRMLDELASRHPITLTYSQLATLAGFTPSGGTATTYRGVLLRAGMMEEDREGGFHVTKKGFDFLGSDIPPTPSTHEEIMDRWRRSVKKGCYDILDFVASRHHEAVTREQIADATGFTVTGGTFTTYLGILRRNGLIEVAENEVRASELLWPS
jgi:hypothetical protein